MIIAGRGKKIQILAINKHVLLHGVVCYEQQQFAPRSCSYKKLTEAELTSRYW